jgi:crossover junction endodeoxyribonuclease RuvC
MPTKSSKIILGLDPGLASTGFGIVKEDAGGKLEMLDYGVIRTPAHSDFADRINTVHKDITEIIKKYKPQVAGVEKLFFCNNAKTALDVGQVRGVIILTLIQNNIPFHEFTPLQVKQTVANHGKADKKQIQQMVKLLLNLKKAPSPDDAADALAIAICARRIN